MDEFYLSFDSSQKYLCDATCRVHATRRKLRNNLYHLLIFILLKNITTDEFINKYWPEAVTTLVSLVHCIH